MPFYLLSKIPPGTINPYRTSRPPPHTPPRIFPPCSLPPPPPTPPPPRPYHYPHRRPRAGTVDYSHSPPIAALHGQGRGLPVTPPRCIRELLRCACPACCCYVWTFCAPCEILWAGEGAVVVQLSFWSWWGW